VSALREHFGAEVPGRVHVAQQAMFGWLLVLGLLHVSEEWSDVIAVWAIGRDPLVAFAPRALVALSALGALALFVGWRGRLAAAVVCASLAALYAWLPVVYHNNTYLAWLMALALGVAGHPEYRLAWIARPARDPSPYVALLPRLVQWQVAIVYVMSVAVKSAHPWWQGTGQVIQWITRERAPASSNGLVNMIVHPALMNLRVASALDVMTMGLEVVVPLMLFTAKWRRTALVLGVMLHTFMQEWLFPQLFTFLMLWGYYAFVPAGDRAWRVRYSPASSVDRALAKVYPYLDWRARTRWEPSDDGDLTLTSPDGKESRGARVLALLTVLSPVTLMAWATFSLPMPHARTVFTLPRDAVENVVILALGSLWLPGLWDGVWKRLRGVTREGAW
jgi:hypothetical protein